ncbi:asialoglycoprotein receptor 1-like [Neoarius graeffei]|uniref:asialoglycoprotein receptor 1-like n=1 Tax=Neoarius graeffei TaxID=443677 RepID=UPI00298C7871|nr:asialoglycoprotein receptor 1-like [Neoarius graeffei]
MESMQYDRFTSSESDSTELYHNKPPAFTPNPQNRRIYVMFGVLTVFLLLLTLTVGIKITQVNQQVSDIVSSLQIVRTSIKASQTDYLAHREPAVPLPVTGPCEDNWVFYKTKCYYVSTQKKSWHIAEKACIQQRAHLLVVNDLEEMEYISQVVEDHLNFWIGLVEREGEGNWSWVDGTDYKTTEKLWDEGQPDDWHIRVNGEDCGQIHAKQNFPSTTTHRLWNDADCTLSYHYICERPA